MLIESNSPQNEIGDGLTIVYISASWCAPCKVYGPQVAKFSKENPDVKIVKVDANSASVALTTLTTVHKFTLRSIPATLTFVDGKLVNTFIGAQLNLLKETVASNKV